MTDTIQTIVANINAKRPILRIVTLGTASVQVGARAWQWAYDNQPYRDRGINLQMRGEPGTITFEAVEIDTGLLRASADNMAELERMLDMRTEPAQFLRAA